MSGVSSLLHHGAQKKAAEANTRAANEAFALTLEDLQARQAQEERAAAQQLAILRTDSLASIGTTKAGAAEAGVGGVSTQLLLSALDRSYFEKQDITTQNLDMTTEQIRRQAEDANATRRARINQVQAPSALPSILGFAGSAMDTLAPYLMNRKPSA